MHKILLIFGTRPEAIKLCPVIRGLREHPNKFDVKVCVTAQHREMLDQVLEAFQVKPDHDLDLMLPGQTLFQSTSRILAGLEPVLRAESPAMVIVQGDTTTTLCGSLGAANDVSISVSRAGVAVDACFANPVAPITTGPGNPMANKRTCPATAGGS